MTLEDKIRYGMLAVTGAGVVLTALGLHLSPLEAATGFGGL